MKVLVSSIAIGVFCLNMLIANNVQILNLGLANHNVFNQEVFIQFDLTWENSWKIGTAPSNWDAVWVFAKYREYNGEWKHATLATVPGSTMVLPQLQSNLLLMGKEASFTGHKMEPGTLASASFNCCGSMVQIRSIM